MKNQAQDSGSLLLQVDEPSGRMLQTVSVDPHDSDSTDGEEGDASDGSEDSDESDGDDGDQQDS